MRNLVELTFDNEGNRYMEIAGNSRETKPTERVITGSLFWETDTAKIFGFDETPGDWLVQDKNATNIAGATVTLGSALTYDGTEKTQAVSSVVVGTSTLTEDTDYKVIRNKGTDAGTYTLYIIGIGEYCGYEPKAFTIAKADGSIVADPAELTLTAGGDDGISALTVTGDGEMSVASSAESYATASLLNNDVIVIPVAEGSATITVSMAASANYNAATATISVTVESGEET